eukprot:gene28791-35713_t
MSFKAVDLEDQVRQAFEDVRSKLAEYPGTKGKAPVVVVRGVGGGKTRGMEELRVKLTAEGIFAILITFGGKWNVGDEDYSIYTAIFQDSPLKASQVYGLSNVSRIASMYYRMPHNEILGILSDNKLDLREHFESQTGSNLIASLLAHIAGQEQFSSGKPVKDVVLMVDEVVQGEKKWKANFPKGFDGTGTLRDATLTHDYSAHGLQVALVLSALEDSVVGSMNSNKILAPFILSESLDPQDVVDNIFLVADANSETNGTIKLVAPSGSKATPNDLRRALHLLAGVLNTSPRMVELAKDELRVRTEDGTLEVSPQMIRDVLSGVMAAIPTKYQHLVQNGLPHPTLLCEMLYGKASEWSPAVTEGITNSLFVNCLSTFPRSTHNEMPTIVLKSSLVTLNAAMGAVSDLSVRSVKRCLQDLFSLMDTWISAAAGGSQSDCLLRDLSLTWMSLKLAAAREDIAARNKVAMASALSQEMVFSVSLQDLLHLDMWSVEHNLKVDTHDAMEAYLEKWISLPKSQPVRVIEIDHSFNNFGDNTSNNAPDNTMLDALNEIALTENRPCAWLKFTAPDSCVDYGLAFLGRKPKDAKPRPHRVVLFGNKGIRERDANGADTQLPTDFTLPGCSSNHPATVVHSVATKFRAERDVNATDRGVGFSVARGDYLFVHQTIQEGRSYAVENTLILGRVDTEKYFNFMFPQYADIRQQGLRSDVNASKLPATLLHIKTLLKGNGLLFTSFPLNNDTNEEKDETQISEGSAMADGRWCTALSVGEHKRLLTASGFRPLTDFSVCIYNGEWTGVISQSV